MKNIYVEMKTSCTSHVSPHTVSVVTNTIWRTKE